MKRGDTTRRWSLQDQGIRRHVVPLPDTTMTATGIVQAWTVPLAVPGEGRFWFAGLNFQFAHGADVANRFHMVLIRAAATTLPLMLFATNNGPLTAGSTGRVHAGFSGDSTTTTTALNTFGTIIVKSINPILLRQDDTITLYHDTSAAVAAGDAFSGITLLLMED